LEPHGILGIFDWVVPHCYNKRDGKVYDTAEHTTSYHQAGHTVFPLPDKLKDVNAYLSSLDESLRPDITVGGLAFVDFGNTYYIVKCFHHVEGVSRWGV
jgi:hypothetical protein